MTIDDPLYVKVDPTFVFCGKSMRATSPVMRAAMELYVNEGIPPGSFLTAVICKELEMAIQRADSNNMWLIPLYYAWFHNEVTAECWGSSEKMRAWVNKKHAEREAKKCP